MKKIAVIDIETTGLKGPKIELILEIGIVELDLDTGDTEIIFNSCVKEPSFGEIHRNSWIFSNSDLSFEEVLNAPLLNEFKQELQEIFNEYPITAFNKKFDLDYFKARGYNLPKELPCIMKSSTNICKIPFPNGNPGNKWPTAQEAWDFFFPDTDYIEEHRAADDALHEAKIMFEMVCRNQFPI